MDILHKLLDISKRAPLPLVLSFLITTIVGFVLLVRITGMDEVLAVYVI